MKAALLALLVGCGSVGAPATMQVRTGTVAYEIPATWTRVDSTGRGIETTVWTPQENPQRMSVTVIRTDHALLLAGADPNTINDLLSQAQNGLGQARMTAPSQVATASGMHGARVDVDFVPPTAKARYHRSHVVLIDGLALVHVMLTSQATDSFGALDTVMSSIRHEEGAK